MSQDKRNRIVRVQEQLGTAHEYLESATRHARESGDGALVKKVEKLATETAQVNKELTEKLSPKQG